LAFLPVQIPRVTLGSSLAISASRITKTTYEFQIPSTASTFAFLPELTAIFTEPTQAIGLAGPKRYALPY
jgi:hypothetical protein